MKSFWSLIKLSDEPDFFLGAGVGAEGAIYGLGGHSTVPEQYKITTLLITVWINKEGFCCSDYQKFRLINQYLYPRPPLYVSYAKKKLNVKIMSSDFCSRVKVLPPLPTAVC